MKKQDEQKLKEIRTDARGNDTKLSNKPNVKDLSEDDMKALQQSMVIKKE